MRFFNKYFFIGFVCGIAVLIGLSFVGAFIFVATRPGDPAEEMEAILPSPSFPSSNKPILYGQVDLNWSVRGVDGRTTNLSEFKNKIILVHFWATWCRPWCVAELPGIQRLYDSLKTEDVHFLIVSWDEDENVLRRFLDERRFSFPVYLRNKETPKALQTEGVPATFILARDGSVLYRHIGPAKWDDESTRAFLRGLL